METNKTTFKRKSLYCLLLSCLFGILFMIGVLYDLSYFLIILFFALSFAAPILYWFIKVYQPSVRTGEIPDKASYRGNCMLIWGVCYMIAIGLPLLVYAFDMTIFGILLLSCCIILTVCSIFKFCKKKRNPMVEVSAVSPKPQSDLSRSQLYNQGLYFIEYKLIPMFIEDVKKDSNREFFLKFIHLWEKGIVKELYFIDWDDLSCEIFGDEMTEYIILYDFPTPFDIPLAKYGAVYINKQKQIYSYYTLEKSMGGYMLCSRNSESHINYGKREDMTKIEFIREICILQNINESSLKGWRLEKGKNSVSEYIDLRGNVYKNQSSKSVGPTMIELKDDDYDNYIANNPRVIVCFYDYKGPSKMMMDILSECAINYKDKIAVAIYDVYGDRNEIIRTKLNIMAMPTFLIYKNGEAIHKQIGLCNSDAMKKMFEDLLS